ncbi:hypothetical protein MLD38_005871 [Melastoma candidum]|uniref:Uncharacterized protein n=1 Tax=Melastoma candidum TaxID=119954 RepID=A0ACB9RQ85_9MYRT|nr:hypothetical protein MLD38_005871 [Melastoma candidum]
MMFHAQGPSRYHCSLLAVVCGRVDGNDRQKQVAPEDQPRYRFPELTSSGRLQVNVLKTPSCDELRQALELLQPNLVYFEGAKYEDSDEVGSLVLGNAEVYLEIPGGEQFAEGLHSKGIPFVIFWHETCSGYAASHFRQALFSVVQSSCSHIWDAFQVAYASYRLYCEQSLNNSTRQMEQATDKLGPDLLGEPPKIDIAMPEVNAQEDVDSTETLPEIQIYDDDVNIRLLVCGVPSKLNYGLVGALEDGLNALLRIEIRGSRLHNRSSAPPPPLHAGAFSRGVVTMKCDICTCSSAHISLLVSGCADTCFSDQMLENHIKNEIIENSQLVRVLPTYEETDFSLVEPRKSASIACGSSVFEVCAKVPTWASQVLRQLAPDIAYRSLVMMGVASIQGLSVASFEKDDAERLLFFWQKKALEPKSFCPISPPAWLTPPPPSRRSVDFGQDVKQSNSRDENGGTSKKRVFHIATIMPIPHSRHHKILPLSGVSEVKRFEGDQLKTRFPVGASKHTPVNPPGSGRRSSTSSYQAQQFISLNPLALKKHGCGRAPIHVCSEEEFVRDVMQFLIHRGHTRLVPQGGIAEFPDAVLNAKRLDLFNLYREVVSRGGFNVGNGINWKGQVFSKMRNYTSTNRMTGVGNTLKRHYETYLLEYELAHDDVGGDCCMLCHSSTAGDWVNCGICGEWAHFGCDRRQGLGAFKDYAKTAGLEYICPHCSASNYKKKPQKSANGY